MWSENTPLKSRQTIKDGSKRYTDLRATFKHIYKTEGAIAFSKGILPRMSINVPSTALSWGTYELVKNLLVTREERRD